MNKGCVVQFRNFSSSRRGQSYKDSRSKENPPNVASFCFIAFRVMSKVHQWDRLKFVDTSSVCKQCALVVVPKLQVVYGCRNCKFPVHEKCLLEAQTIRPCADVPTRQLISEAVHQGSLKKVAYHNEEKNRPGRPALSSLVSKPGAPKKRFFILVEGYLYYCKSSDVGLFLPFS